jgi:hypothetical protein
LCAVGSVGIAKICVVWLTKISEAANARKTKLTITFLVFLATDENKLALIAATNPTIRAVPSPPLNTKNKTTRKAPMDAPTKSAAYNLPAIDPNAVNAADITIPMKKNGTEKRSIYNGRYITCDARACITKRLMGIKMVIPHPEKIVRFSAHLPLSFFTRCCTTRPEAPRPTRATDTATNAKWYQIAAENILVIAISSTRPDKAVRNIPANTNLRLTKIGTDSQLVMPYYLAHLLSEF